MQAWHILADGSPGAAVTLSADTVSIPADMTRSAPPPAPPGRWVKFDPSARCWVITDQPPQAAPAEPPQPPGPLSVMDFRRRFTLHEKAAIELAALDNPAAPIEERQQAALLRACLADQAAAQFIDLADPSTIAGVQLLVQAGLLSEERGQQVLLASAAP